MSQDTNGNGYISGIEVNEDRTLEAKKVVDLQKQILAERKQAFAEQRFAKEHALKQKIANKPNTSKR